MPNVFGPYGAGVNPSTTRPTDTDDPGASDTFFVPCSSPTARDGTLVSYRWLNKMLATMRRATRGMAVPDDPASDDLLLEAIRRGATLRNIGVGEDLYQGQDGDKRHLIRRLQAGANVTIIPVNGPSGESALRIAATAPGSGPTGNTLANVGDGADVYKGTNGTTEELRGIKGVGPVGVAANGDNVEVGIPAPQSAILMRAAAGDPGQMSAQTINSLTNEPNPAAADELVLQKAGNGLLRKVTKGALTSHIGGSIIASGSYQYNVSNALTTNIGAGCTLTALGTGPLGDNMQVTFATATADTRYVVQRFVDMTRSYGIDGGVVSSTGRSPVDLPIESLTVNGFILPLSRLMPDGTTSSTNMFHFVVIKL